MNMISKFGRVLSSLLVVCMVFSMGAVAFAEPVEEAPVVEEFQSAVVEEIPSAPVEAAPSAPAAEVQPAPTVAVQPAATAVPVILYTWTHPLTKVVYSGLTFEQYQTMLLNWEKEKAALEAEEEEEDAEEAEETAEEETAAEEAEEAVSAEAEEAVAEEDAEEAVAEEAAEETVGAETPAEKVAEETTVEVKDPPAYSVDYTVGDSVVTVRGDEGISVNDLLAALGIEIPEGAEISIDPASIDTENLTVSEVDGKLVITSNKEFFEADRDLVILVNGVPTTVKVTDPKKASVFITDTEGKTNNKLADSVKIEKGSGSVVYDSGETVIDLNGKTIVGDENAEYAFKVEGSTAVGSDTVKVTFMNGTIEAAKSAVEVVGNAIVNFFNMTVKAAKEVLHIDSTNNQGKTGEVATTAVIDKKTTLITTDALANDPSEQNDTVMLDGRNSDFYADGTIVNYANGFAIGKKSPVSFPLDDSLIILDKNASLFAAHKQEDLAPDISPDNIYSKGASFVHEKGLADKFVLVLDLNYDTLYSIVTVDRRDRLPANPTRAGHTFIGWNTAPDGSGYYMTREYAIDHGYGKLYAIWSPVNPDYAWLIRGTVEGTTVKTYIAHTRMNIEKRTATIFFDNNSKVHQSPIKVEFLNVKYLKNMGVDTAKVELDKNLFVEFNLDDLLEKGVAGGDKNNNIITIERDKKDLVTVSSGKVDVFCFDAVEIAKATKNDLILSFKNDTVTVFYGKDEICDTKLPSGQYSMLKLDSKARSLSVSKAK